VSPAANGDVVIALQAHGDLRGLVTLTLHADGDTIAGEWSLVSAYFQDVDENGNPIDPEPTEEDKPHLERITYVNNGTLGGTIDGGHVIVNADGDVAGIEGLRLTIVSSTLAFEGASGGGSLESPALTDGGSLSLTF